MGGWKRESQEKDGLREENVVRRAKQKLENQNIVSDPAYVIVHEKWDALAVASMIRLRLMATRVWLKIILGTTFIHGQFFIFSSFRMGRWWRGYILWARCSCWA